MFSASMQIRQGCFWRLSGISLFDTLATEGTHTTYADRYEKGSKNIYTFLNARRPSISSKRSVLIPEEAEHDIRTGLYILVAFYVLALRKLVYMSRSRCGKSIIYLLVPEFAHVNMKFVYRFSY